MFKFLPKYLPLLFLLVGFAAHANADPMTYGPITLGDNTFLLEPYYYPQYNVVQTGLPSLAVGPLDGSHYWSGSVSFAYDLAPGWIATPSVRDIGDFLTTDQFEDNRNFVAAYFQEVILCPSSSPVACTSGSVSQGTFGNLSLLPSIGLTPNAVAQPGTGIYEWAEYTYNADVEPGEMANLNIYLTQTPEPSTLILLGTGFVGFAGAARRKYLSRL